MPQPTLADLLATPKQVSYKGKTYHLSEMTIEHRAKFSRWLERRARDEAARAAMELPEEAGERYMRVIVREIASGAFEWGSLASVQALLGHKGAAYALTLRLSEQHPEVDEEFAEEIVLGMLAERVSAFTAGLESADPKARAAAEALLKAFGLKPPSSAAPPSNSAEPPNPDSAPPPSGS
jgi:hypothetical protein